MPEFREYAEVEIEVTPSDFIDKCNKYEIQELIEELVDREFIKENSIKSIDNAENGITVQEYEFDKAIDKISRNRLQLTIEEDVILQKIALRLI